MSNITYVDKQKSGTQRAFAEVSTEIYKVMKEIMKEFVFASRSARYAIY